MNWNLGPYGFDRQSQSDEETLESIKDPAGMVVNCEENSFALWNWNIFKGNDPSCHRHWIWQAVDFCRVWLIQEPFRQHVHNV